MINIMTRISLVKEEISGRFSSAQKDIVHAYKLAVHKAGYTLRKKDIFAQTQYSHSVFRHEDIARIDSTIHRPIIRNFGKALSENSPEAQKTLAAFGGLSGLDTQEQAFIKGFFDTMASNNSNYVVFPSTGTRFSQEAFPDGNGVLESAELLRHLRLIDSYVDKGPGSAGLFAEDRVIFMPSVKMYDELKKWDDPAMAGFVRINDLGDTSPAVTTIVGGFEKALGVPEKPLMQKVQRLLGHVFAQH